MKNGSTKKPMYREQLKQMYREQMENARGPSRTLEEAFPWVEPRQMHELRKGLHSVVSTAASIICRKTLGPVAKKPTQNGPALDRGSLKAHCDMYTELAEELKEVIVDTVIDNVERLLATNSD